MKTILILILAFNNIWAIEALFKSSFEDGVYLDPPDRKNSEIWWQSLKGSDVENFSWPIQLNGEEGQFQMIVNNNDIHHYLENEIIHDVNKNGKKTKVLYQNVKEKEHSWAQDPYVIHTKNKEIKQLYLRYDLKFEENLSDKLGEHGWLTFSEYKTYSDYRQAVYIYRDESKKLYWFVHGDNVAKENVLYKEYWSRENKEVVVPQGEWMDIEMFWKRSKKNGRFWLAVNGEIVFDYLGPTKLEEPIFQVMLFTNYANVPLAQWLDNVQIWNDFPCGIGKSCYAQGK